MDLVSLILLCSLAQSADTNSMLYQMAQTNNGDPTYIDDLTDGVVYTPPTVSQASQMVGALVEAGHDIRVGVMQLPAREVMRSYDLSTVELVDSCRNVAVASDRLTQARRKYPSKSSQALAWYLTGDSESAIGLSWAFDVLAVEPVELEKRIGDVENPLPSRKYSRTQSLIFVGDNSSEKAGSKTQPDSSLLLDSAKPRVVPEKWEPVPPSQRSTSNSRATPSSSSNTASETKSPQESVTDERLPTSDQLKNDRAQGGN